MDNELISAKLESLARCIHRISSQGISSPEELAQDIDKQEIIILNLQRAVQICVNIGNHILLDYDSPTPATMAETFKYLAQNKTISQENAMNMSRSVGFRNIAVHQYDDIDMNILYSVIKIFT